MIPSLLELCSHSYDIIREHAVRVLREVLKQGMINPVDVMPTLIAITTDPVEVTRDLALAEIAAARRSARRASRYRTTAAFEADIPPHAGPAIRSTGL